MRSKKKYLIDGRFLNSMTTGIDRYAYQLLACLDKICKGSDIAILVPANAKEIPAYKNIRVNCQKTDTFLDTAGIWPVCTAARQDTGQSVQ